MMGTTGELTTVVFNDVNYKKFLCSPAARKATQNLIEILEALI